MSDRNATHKLVQKAYGDVADRQSSCCGSAKSCCSETKPYTVPDNPVPESELGLSCGNPVAFGHINKGDVVVDLGSGAGKDVFLAAQKVGPAGRSIGVDMTPQMIALARKNVAKFVKTTGLNNVEFREGYIEHLPLDDGSANVVISNCVINLSPDKPQVFREVHRVLRKGGRMLVSDIVLNRMLPASLRDDSDLHVACIAGALLRDDYIGAIRQAGFTDVQVLSDIVYAAGSSGDDPLTSKAAKTLEGVASSITVMAVKTA